MSVIADVYLFSCSEPRVPEVRVQGAIGPPMLQLSVAAVTSCNCCLKHLFMLQVYFSDDMCVLMSKFIYTSQPKHSVFLKVG